MTNTWGFLNWWKKPWVFKNCLNSLHIVSQKKVMVWEKESTKCRMFLYIARATSQLCPNQCPARSSSSKGFCIWQVTGDKPRHQWLLCVHHWGHACMVIHMPSGEILPKTWQEALKPLQGEEKELFHFCPCVVCIGSSGQSIQHQHKTGWTHLSSTLSKKTRRGSGCKFCNVCRVPD